MPLILFYLATVKKNCMLIVNQSENTFLLKKNTHPKCMDFKKLKKAGFENFPYLRNLQGVHKVCTWF